LLGALEVSASINNDSQGFGDIGIVGKGLARLQSRVIGPLVVPQPFTVNGGQEFVRGRKEGEAGEDLLAGLFGGVQVALLLVKGRGSRQRRNVIRVGLEQVLNLSGRLLGL